MCGILGMVSPAPIPEGETLVRMRETLRHRGPDDAGTWWSADRRAGLAHRRLAIIDLSPGGHQPMTDPSGQVALVFNGEIYNYRELRRELEGRGRALRTASDSEVVLEAFLEWGRAFVERLNGMFALGIYDSRDRTLFLARDRAGEKPLYYWPTAGKLVFSSELKAIMEDPACPRRLDTGALEFYLAYGYVPGEMCMLSGVRKLHAAGALAYELDADRITSWRYWRLPEHHPVEGRPEAELVDELEALLLDAVRLRLVADVPVGILLSGGIDSSLVTALAARASTGPVHTFTISFPGHGAYDESSHARLVAGHFGTMHTEMTAEPATVDLLPDLARQFDEPSADSSMVPTYLVSRLVRRHATVALGGDGGDELFGGYPHHSWTQRPSAIRWLAPGPLRRGLAVAARNVVPMGVRGRNWLLGQLVDRTAALAQPNLHFDAPARRRLLRPMGGHGPAVTPEQYKIDLCDPAHSLLQQATRLDFGTYLVDDILVKVDRASMLTSLEVRAPWLDHRCIEFAFGRVPDALRATAHERKRLPRVLAQRLLPPQLDLSRKQGFSLPLQAWFKGSWGAYVEEVLREADAGIFDRRVIHSLLAGQRRGLGNTPRLFALVMFELWRREYRIGLGGDGTGAPGPFPA
jgi:asparagine synthase (glutamine-hydrolysing)